MIRFFFKFLFGITGWRIEGAWPGELKKCVLIVAPHTSMMDFFIGVAARSIGGFRANYLVKEELFRFPLLSWFLRITGGIPIARAGEKKNGVVDSIIQLFEEREALILALAPEGTRKKVEHFKTGFYRIARGAKVPIVLVAFDFEHKVVQYLGVYRPTGVMEEDMAYIENQYRGIKGKKSALSF